MQNASGQYVDLYVPRKCSWTNRLIHSADYASVSLNIAKVDAASGQRLPENDTFCLSGYIRSKVFFALNLPQNCLLPTGDSGSVSCSRLIGVGPNVCFLFLFFCPPSLS